MFSREMEYFKLRDILSDKLIYLCNCEVLTKEIAENIYDDVLFSLLEHRVRISDDKYINKLISYEISDYCLEHECLGFCAENNVINMIILNILTDGKETKDGVSALNEYSINYRDEKERRIYRLCLY